MSKNLLYAFFLGVAFSFIGHSFYNAVKDKFVFDDNPYTQLAQVTAPGTLYTVCSSGCTSTTIQGLFNSKTLAPDDVVEVRADTAGGSKTYNEVVRVSGNGSNGHPIILRARAGDNITIDSQNAVGNTIYVGANYFVVEGFRIQGSQGAQVLVGKVGSCSLPWHNDVTIRNNSIYISSVDGNQNHNGINVGCANNVLLKNNTITTSNADLGLNDSDCFYASSFNGLVVDGNSCTISNSATGVGLSAPHNDGLQISGGNGTNFALGTASNLTIKNNSFIHVGNRQGYKQCIYIEYEVQGEINIFNNVCKDTAPPNNNILSVANKGYGTQGKVRIYNNSIFINGSPTAGIITDEGVHNPSIKNNIVLWSGNNDYQTCISANSSTLTPSEIDNNVCYKVGGTVLQNQAKASFHPWTNWRSLGYDVHGYNALPLFVNQSSQPYDLHLQATSPAINKGADLSTFFTTDKDGNTRGSGGAWDIGAYEYIGTTTPPTTYVLIVNNGSGSGTYTAGTSVAIFANAAPSGQVFDRWTGATVASLTSPSTILTMPASATSVTATYKVATVSDTSLPTVNLTAPTVGATVSGTITLSATASDNVGVAGVQFKLDGANFGAEDTTSPYSISWNTTTVANGNHTITAVTRDTSGNTATASLVTVLVSNATTSTGPTAHWTFDTADISGSTILDKSGNGNNGTASNFDTTTFFTSGKVGQALNFDGVNDVIRIPGVSVGTITTASMWIYPKPTKKYGTLLAQDNGVGVWHEQTTNKITFYYNSSDHFNATALTPNTWNHVAIVNNGGTVTFYLNGVVDGTATGAPGFLVNYIGDDNSSETYGGSLDDVRIYNRALSTSEIQSLYNTAGGTTPPPTIYTLSVTKSGTGSGTVTGGSINCGTTCTQAVNAGTTITLTSTPDTGSTFSGWSGACTGTNTTCTRTINSNTSIIATFTSTPVTNSMGVGSRVKVSGSKVYVRSTPDVSPFSRLGTQRKGAIGTITEGPETADGYTWWKVDFDSGTDGWVAEKYLEL